VPDNFDDARYSRNSDAAGWSSAASASSSVVFNSIPKEANALATASGEFQLVTPKRFPALGTDSSSCSRSRPVHASVSAATASQATRSSPTPREAAHATAGSAAISVSTVAARFASVISVASSSHNASGSSASRAAYSRCDEDSEPDQSALCSSLSSVTPRCR
jgi:hypothetical protein